MSGPSGKPFDWLAISLVVSGITALIFWPSTQFEWLKYWDDGAHLMWNEQYKGLSLTYLWWMAQPFLGQWMPLTWLSWAIDFTLWGLDPVAYHRTNVLLHAANAGLLFLVARRMIRAVNPRYTDRILAVGAAFAALLWALHPLRVESVAWVNERRDVLCGLFYLLALLSYLKAADATAHRRRWLGFGVFCFGLAVLSKALAVTLPITVILISYYPLRHIRPSWSLLWQRVPFFAVSAVLISLVGTIMAFVAIAQMDVLATVQYITIEDRLLITPYSLWFYLAKTVWPGVLSPLYELTFTPHLLQWRYFIPVVGVSLATWLAIGARRTWPGWTVAWFAYVIAVFPISGVFQNGYQIVASRYSYLATIPLLILAGGLLVAALDRLRVPAYVLTVSTAVGVVVALAAGTTAYLPVFRDGISFWIQAVRVEPSCVACSDFLVHQAKFRVAHAEMARVIDRYPDLQEQRFQIGMLAFMYARGKAGEAHFTEYLRQAAERNPGYIARIEVGRQQHLALARKVLTGSPQTNLNDTFEGAAYGLAPAR